MPPSTLDYWARIGLVRPSLHGSNGRRAERWWTVTDVVVVRTIRALREAGASLQQVRRAKKLLDEWGKPMSGARLYWDGHDILIEGPDGELASALMQPGQYVLQLTVLPIGEWHDQARELEREVDLDDLRRRAVRRRRVRAQAAASTQRVLVVPG